MVITSPRLVKQLVDKKGIYNYRSPSYIGNGIITRNDHVLLMQYSDTWRTCRKLIHQVSSRGYDVTDGSNTRT